MAREYGFFYRTNRWNLHYSSNCQPQTVAKTSAPAYHSSMEKIERMHWLYGLDPGRRCRECSRLEWMRTGGQTVCKCAIYGVNPGEATDWSADWEACGLRNRSYAGVKIQTLEDAGPKTP